MKFWNNMKIGPKLILLTIGLIVILVSIITFINLRGTNSFIKDEYEINTQKNVGLIEYQFDIMKTNATNCAVSIAKNDDFINAMKSGNRNAVIQAALIASKGMDIEFYTISDEVDNVVYRNTSPNKYGDNIGKNDDVVGAKSGKTTAGVILGKTHPISVRSAVPIYDATNKIIGVISAGYDIKNPEILDKFKKMFDADFTIFRGDTRYNTTVISDGKRAVGTKLKPEIAEIVLNQGKDFSGQTDVLNVPKIVYYKPLKDINKKTVGILFCGMSLVKANELRNDLIVENIIYTLVFLVIISIILYYIIKKLVIYPVSNSVKMADDISNGNFTDNIAKQHSNNEFGKLYFSFGNMQTNIKDVINEINQVSEQTTKGNFQHKADASKFRGEYKSLVEGVNRLINALAEPLLILSNYYADFADGVIPNEIPDKNRGGEFARIRENVNSLINTLKAMQTDGALLIKGVQDGIIQDVRADASKHKGIYYEIIQGFNNTLDTIASPMVEMFYTLEKLVKGDLSAKMVGQYNGSFKLLKENLNKTIASLPLNEIMDVMQNMAGGDLTVKITGDYDGDNLKIKDAVNETINSLNHILSNVKTTVDEVTRASMQVSDTSTALSQGATEQAASLEEITSSMNQIGSQTRQNAENSNIANNLANNAKTAAENGNVEMVELTQAMNEINVSSQNISKIIKVIDEIAFQTNLLALNAAVEAARAGRHGKGFAVVAEEVRNLAARSATAAKETSEMIENSIKTVNLGSELVYKTGEALNNIKSEAVKVADIIGEITTSSNEQAQGISQINEGLSQIDRVTQTNTASAEESASAASQLSGQASQLRELVDRFKLSGDNYSEQLAYGRRTFGISKRRSLLADNDMQE